MTTEDEFDALLGSLNFESIRIPPTDPLGPGADSDYGELTISSTSTPPTKNSIAVVVAGSIDEDDQSRLGDLPPLPATDSAAIDEIDAEGDADSNRDFSHIDASTLDEILDLPDLPSSPTTTLSASGAAASSPYGQFPSANKHSSPPVASSPSSGVAASSSASNSSASSSPRSAEPTPG
jgi:hypothetical protein